MMQKVINYLMIFVITGLAFSFAVPPKAEVKWISVQELNEVYSKNPKPILLDIYTDWCGWCKEMDRKTYKNEKLANYVNEHYYAVKFNAESKDSVFFNNQGYGYNAKLKSNEFAEYLLFGRLEFPTTVFLPTIDARPAPLSGYLTPKEMEAPLKYFGGGFHKTQTFVEYNQATKNEW